MRDNKNIYDVVVIGGGAAGFFSALHIAENKPLWRILLVEKTEQVLSKVKVSGGGRCNVTHSPMHDKAFSKYYPRGEKIIQKLLKHFSAKDTIAWFEKKGVKLKTEDDGRMFPESNTSQTIIDCFLKLAKELNITILYKCGITAVTQRNGLFEIETSMSTLITSNYVVACTGGKPNTNHYDWVKKTNTTITSLHPSLFTFNANQHILKSLAGVSVPHARVRIRSSKLEEQGPLLITHWGLSGPCILRLSAWGAVELANKEYNFDALIAWDASFNEAFLKDKIQHTIKEHGKKKIINTPFHPLPKRLWEVLITYADISEELTWNNINHKKTFKLIEQLMSFPFFL